MTPRLDRNASQRAARHGVPALEPGRVGRAAAACAGAALLALMLLSPALVRAAGSGVVGADAAAMRRALASHVLTGVDGRRLPLASLQGEVVVLNFWASWCRPCRHELPALDRLNASLAGRGARVLAVSIDEDLRNVTRFVESNGLTLPVYHDGPDGLARDLALQHIPCTLVLDRDGNVVWTTSGSDAGALDALARRTEALLAPSQALAIPARGASE